MGRINCILAKRTTKLWSSGRPALPTISYDLSTAIASLASRGANGPMWRRVWRTHTYLANKYRMWYSGRGVGV